MSLELRITSLIPPVIGCPSHMMRDEVLGFDKLNFGLIYSELLAGNRRPNVDFIFHDDYLFQGSQLCIPSISFRDFLLWEMHEGH